MPIRLLPKPIGPALATAVATRHQPSLLPQKLVSLQFGCGPLDEKRHP
jgi:hypothetical protein